MKFDREAACGGVEAVCRLENGKAILEWKLFFTGKDGADEGGMIQIRLMDREGNVAVECIQDAYEEEALESILVQPHLWNGPGYPYLYHMEAVLMSGDGRELDRICRQIPLRSISLRGEELFLNDTPITPKIVRYLFPLGISGAVLQQLMMEDLRQILAAGANAVSVEKEKEELLRTLQPMCDRMGILSCFDGEWAAEKEMPVFRGGENSFFKPGSKCPTSLFYRYKARWSQEPFVYIVPESVRKLESGNYMVLCYSNCSRVALYSDGILFEFQRGEGEFVFREFPAKGPCIMLTAEGDGCSESLSLHKIYLRKH